MQEITRYFLENWQLLLVPTAVFAIVMVAGLFARRILFSRLHNWAARTTSQIDDDTLQTLHGPFLLWVAILSLHLATQSAPLPPKASGLLSKVFLILWIVSLTIVASRLVALFIRHKGSALHGALPVTTLTQTLGRLFVISCGLLILLNTLGISITPILTALGVGGLAVALALQDTLSNLFAGFYLSIAGQVRAGDYIKLSSGEEGYVADTNWRSTTLRALANNYIVVPNAHLAQAILTNYHLPEKRMSLSIPVSVSYECDPDEIEQMLVEEAVAAAPDIPGLMANPSPFVRFIPGFGASSLDFTLICQVNEFVDQYLVQHELRKRIFRRFRRDGVQIPFPSRTVYMYNQQTVAPVDTTGGRRNAASA
ncbi:mechanosensitive ion channel family protein [uncultured Paludibaculum sp.]|uniref:mechanosensitive ion channel family protein n=1 Tax=uncultured Paludibaculum sp. TaxID=1765020 RepID=UPI002AABFFB4|nr:mechanosensitive ion channel family protein [uncultured Paludibaculum sp.]